jgi:hypothetical protein
LFPDFELVDQIVTGLHLAIPPGQAETVTQQALKQYALVVKAEMIKKVLPVQILLSQVYLLDWLMGL